MSIISECTSVSFELLKSEEIVIDNSSIGLASECKFKLPAFAYPTDPTDTYRNDFTGSLLPLTNRYSNPEFYLDVETSCDVWSEVAQLTDSTYGTFFTFSSRPDWAGFKLDWLKVFNLEDAGCYRIRQQYTDITDASTKINLSFKYELKLFSANLADRTTKFTYTINGGIMGDPLSDTNTIDFGSVIWDKEIRLPDSQLFGESSEYTREVTRYKNGAQTPIKDEQVETIGYYAKKLPYSLHREIKVTALMCGELFISDYNTGNVVVYNMKRLSPSSGYEPIWSTYTSYAPVSLTFQPYFENLRRKQC